MGSFRLGSGPMGLFTCLETVNVPKGKMAEVMKLLKKDSSPQVVGTNAGVPIVYSSQPPVTGALHGAGFNNHQWHNIWEGFHGGRHNISPGSARGKAPTRKRRIVDRCGA